MEIWLDTADAALVEQTKEMGILHGVTTNPSILAQSKLSAEEALEKLLQAQNGPVTAQVTASQSDKMIEQGLALHQFSHRIIVKVPVTKEGLKAIYALSQKKVPIMATAVFTSPQVLFALRAGAQYVAPYFSSICESDPTGVSEFNKMLKLLRHYQFPAKLIAASLKSTEQVQECLDAGADAITLNPALFAAWIQDHEDTVERLQKFAKDWKGAKPSKKIPL
ncbi:MAG: hypothetical protein KGQ49_05105 [Verrucomicrobia bacterium]|nr:hypothetical protein [Verrucomicrobiota bacterium]MBU6446759.1 hypothetical protein [Verrucomicrobiota bacterium]MDE3047485.1 hypothetical protein [Verrucomicrobiota bacterium]